MNPEIGGALIGLGVVVVGYLFRNLFAAHR